MFTILNQNKDMLVSLDVTAKILIISESIVFTCDETNLNTLSIEKINLYRCTHLGSYKNKKRLIEVLNEIYAAIKKDDKGYEMPKE